MQMAKTRAAHWWAAVGAIALVGLALRLLAARGGLWTDEAWSVIYAAQARDPIGVFLRINHDNNHHLNSLWLQAIGPAAPPMLARAPSILAGNVVRLRRGLACRTTLEGCGNRRGAVLRSHADLRGLRFRSAGLCDDAARGADDAAARRRRPRRAAGARRAPGGSRLLALLGMFSHLTMAAPVAIAALWVYLEWRRERGPRQALPAH